jgi:hypothetical protein
MNNIHVQQMKKTDFSWIWVGALSGITFGVVSAIYSQWQRDEFNRIEKEKYQQMSNGMQEFKARAAKSKERTET